MSRRDGAPKATLVALLVIGGGAGASFAAVEKADPAAAQPVIERMLSALGGRRAIDGLASLAVEADCSGPGGPFRTRVESLRPDAVHFVQRAGDHTTELWSTGEATWRLDAAGEPEIVDDGARSFLRGHEFHLLVLELEERFSEHRLGGADRVEGRACRRIAMRDADGRPASLCVDDESFLPLELVTNPPGAAGPLTLRPADWREVGGILYFHSFELGEGPDRVFTYRYDSIRPGAVSGEQFAAPAPPAG